MIYSTCYMGDAFVVGLSGTPDEVTVDVNLAHNFFNAGAFYDIFNGRINFDSPAQFMKFLIYKAMFVNGECLRSAAKTARRVLTEQTRRVNFMRQLRLQTTNHLYTVSTYESKD